MSWSLDSFLPIELTHAEPAVEDAGGDPSGWPVPAWTPAATEASLERNGAATAILSLTSPGAPIAGSDAGARDLARKANEYCATLRDSNPQRYGFFAAMPNALDTEGTLAEIAYALDHLSADGVTLFTRYGDGNNYLGHRALAPIWAELNRRRAVVFIHPTHPVDTNKVNPKLLQPSVDYPHETTRTVLDILMSNTRRDNPDCRIILPHAGGTLPWIFPRTTTMLRGIPREQTPLGKTYEEMWAEFRSFYFDLALSSSHAGLDLLLKIVPDDHILYGKASAEDP